MRDLSGCWTLSDEGGADVIALDLPGDGRSALAQAELQRELGRRSAPAVTVMPGCPARIALPPEDPLAVPDVTVLDRRPTTSCA